MSKSGGELLRYGLNGLVATAVHFGVLHLAIDVAHMPSAGLANALASLFGITASFFGNRHFVFAGRREGLASQAMKFMSLYAFIAVLHGVTLLVWTDLLSWDYRAGFALAVALQFVLGYLGSRRYVFNHDASGRNST